MARAKKATRTATASAPSGQKPKAGRWEETRERRELRKVLQARLNEVLDSSNLPERGRGSYIALVTHRSKQAVALWLNRKGGGLPDAIALRQLALALKIDPAYLLGLTKVSRRSGQIAGDDDASVRARAEWLDGLEDELRRRSDSTTSFVMDGDEMEPTIRRGAMVLVDRNASVPSRSGPYAVETNDRLTVRMVESRLGGGVILRCENKRYGEQLTVGKEVDLKKHGVQVVGKVIGWLDANWT